MAGPRTCFSPRRNPPPVGEDELTGTAPTKGSGTLTPTSIVFRARTPALATAPAVALSSVNKLFK